MIIQLLTSQTKSLIPYCNANTAVILLQNGVYAAAKILQEFPNSQLFALENDWRASGLDLNEKVNLISALQWVELCAMHQPVITIQNAN
jgi:sulfur relay protein TusB/DsrH